MNLRQKAVKGVAWTAIQSGGTQAISSIIFFLLARLLGPEVFGLVAMAGVFLAILQVFSEQGFTEAIIQRNKLEPEHLDTAFWSNLGIGLLLTLLSIAAAKPVSILFNQPKLTPIIGCLSLSFLLGAFRATQEAILRRQFNFMALAIRSLVATGIGGIVGVVMAFLGYGVWSLVGQQLVNQLVGVLVLWRSSNWRPGLKFSLNHFKELFAYGINLVGMNFLNFFNQRADDLLIGYFLGPVALGYYSVPYRIFTMLAALLPGSAVQVALPTFSRLQEDPERLRQAFYTAGQLTSLICFPIFFGLAALAPELLPGLLGDKWIPSIPVMRVLAFVGVLFSISYFYGSVIMAMGKPDWAMKISFINAVTSILAFLVAVRWGIVAVAVAFLLRVLVEFPIPLWATHKLIHLDMATYFGKYVAPLSGSLVMVAVLVGAREFLGSSMNLYAALLLYAVLGASVYSLTIFLFAPSLFQKALNLLKFSFKKSSIT
jgi:PST family polysaccharide transporter